MLCLFFAVSFLLWVPGLLRSDLGSCTNAGPFGKQKHNFAHSVAVPWNGRLHKFPCCENRAWLEQIPPLETMPLFWLKIDSPLILLGEDQKLFPFSCTVFTHPHFYCVPSLQHTQSYARRVHNLAMGKKFIIFLFWKLEGIELNHRSDGRRKKPCCVSSVL